MTSNFFFKKKNIKIKDIYQISFKNNFIINDIKPLDKAKEKDISFLTQLNIKVLQQKLKRGFA